MKSVIFKRKIIRNVFPQIARETVKDIDGTAMHLAAVTRKIAIRSMRKGPKNPKSRFGQLKARRTGKRRGTYFWQKGWYSRPGHPPFWHTSQGLKLIYFEKVSHGKYEIKLKRFKGSKVPELHEFGGRIKKRNENYHHRRYWEYKDKTGAIKRKLTKFEKGPMRRPLGKTAVYPKRPYLAPALIKGLTHIHKSKTFISRGNSIARMKAVKKMRPVRRLVAA